MNDRIEVTEQNVHSLMDEVDSGFLADWMTARELCETFRVSKTQVREWAGQGAVEQRGTGKYFGCREQLQYNVIDFLRERAARRCLKQKREVEERDGVLYVECVDCPQGENMHPRSGFYANGGAALGIGVRCKKCHNKRGSEWERKNKDKGREKRKRAARKAAADARAAYRWQPPIWIDTKAIVDIIDERFPKEDHQTQPAHDRLLCERAGMDEDFIRSIRRSKKTRVRLADELLTGLELTHDLANMHAALEIDRPRWHPKHAYCVRCYRVAVPHHAKGLCRTCHRNRNVPGWKPPLAKLGAEAWSMYHPCCVKCGRTDSRHHARGECDRCYQLLKQRRERAASVGSGHGNDGLVQEQAEATSHGSGGWDDRGRVACHP